MKVIKNFLLLSQKIPKKVFYLMFLNPSSVNRIHWLLINKIFINLKIWLQDLAIIFSTIINLIKIILLENKTV